MKAVLVSVLAVVLGTGLGYGLSYSIHGEGSGFDPLKPMANLVDDPFITPSPTGPQPKLVVEEPNADLGPWAIDVPVSHDFVIRNTGEANLHLITKNANGENMNLRLGSNDLAPGESTQLNVAWEDEATEVGGVWTSTAMIGPFSRTISLLTNDPAEPRKLLTLVGTNVRAVALQDEEFRLGTYDQAKEQVIDTAIYAYHTDQLEILGEQFLRPHLAKYFEVTYKPVPKEELSKLPAEAGLSPQVGYRVQVKLKPGIPMGPFAQEITFSARPQPKKRLALVIAGQIEADVSMGGLNWDRTAKALYLGNVIANEGVTRSMMLYFKGEHRRDIDLKFVEATPSSIQVTIGLPEEFKDGEEIGYKITATVPPNAPLAEYGGPLSGGQYGSLIFSTKHPLMERIEVPVRVTIFQ